MQCSAHANNSVHRICNAVLQSGKEMHNATQCTCKLCNGMHMQCTNIIRVKHCVVHPACYEVKNAKHNAMQRTNAMQCIAYASHTNTIMQRQIMQCIAHAYAPFAYATHMQMMQGTAYAMYKNIQGSALCHAQCSALRSEKFNG